ncbi:MAG: ATP-binding cassette domain-containing protein [Bacteroidales bacterium]|nr:ATP-binding cassette domain-containing protein [Bacteroidales bacterium]
MVSVDNLSVYFGDFVLFSDVSFLVGSRDRIGLTGKNGAGKTTLLRLISGLQSPTSGGVMVPSATTIGYLPQHMKLRNKNSVLEETISSFTKIKKIEHEIEDITGQLEGREDHHSGEYLELCNRLADMQELYNINGGNSYVADAEQALTGLGFERTDFLRPTSELSGGWRMRIELAKLLLKRPSLLLLDEPTNHLDIESIEWLESFLTSYPGALMLVSHDRAFLDNVTNRTLEISAGKIYDYKVSYSKYVELRAERREQQLSAYRNQQKMIEDTEKFIERFRYKATKAVQVQSRIKQLDKVDRIEIDEEDNSAISIRFAPAPRSGTIVIETENLSKSYGSLNVLNNIDVTIQRGEKVAFVGRNGEGKTTLSRIITGETNYTGKIKLGHNTRTGYFAQNQDELLDESLTVFETIDNIATGDIRSRLRAILGAFLFGGDDIDKKVKVLSGGERSRLALIRLLLEPYNLLLLDEPTNHLDMRSKDILKQALINYDGTLIVVSHDRDFLDGLVTKVFEFRHHKIREHLGGIYDFLRSRKLENLKQIERKAAVSAATKSSGKNSEKSGEKSSRDEYLARREKEKELRKSRRELTEMEHRIENLEKEKERLVEILSNPEMTGSTEGKVGDGAGDDEIYFRYEGVRNEMEELMRRWEEISLKIESMDQNNVDEK